MPRPAPIWPGLGSDPTLGSRHTADSKDRCMYLGSPSPFPTPLAVIHNIVTGQTDPLRQDGSQHGDAKGRTCIGFSPCRNTQSILMAVASRPCPAKLEAILHSGWRDSSTGGLSRAGHDASIGWCMCYDCISCSILFLFSSRLLTFSQPYCTQILGDLGYATSRTPSVSSLPCYSELACGC